MIVWQQREVKVRGVEFLNWWTNPWSCKTNILGTAGFRYWLFFLLVVLFVCFCQKHLKLSWFEKLLFLVSWDPKSATAARQMCVDFSLTRNSSKKTKRLLNKQVNKKITFRFYYHETRWVNFLRKFKELRKGSRRRIYKQMSSQSWFFFPENTVTFWLSTILWGPWGKNKNKKPTKTSHQLWGLFSQREVLNTSDPGTWERVMQSLLWCCLWWSVPGCACVLIQLMGLVIVYIDARVFRG